MNGRRVLVLTSFLLAFSVAVPGVAAAKRAGTDRPVKGSFSQTTTGDLATGTATSEGTGIISHLGKSAIATNATFTVTPTTVTNSGTSTVTAANGDQLFATFTASVPLESPVLAVGDTADSTVVFTITGGTGRFSDASGTVTVDLHQEVVSLVGATIVLNDTGTFQGRISY
jgi:hypothetical protein